MIHFILVASVLGQDPTRFQIAGTQSVIQFGSQDDSVTLIRNATEDELVCSGKFKATDVLIEGTTTTVAQMMAEHATMKDDIAALKRFVGMMPPSSPPPSFPILYDEPCANISSAYQFGTKALPAAVDGAWVYDGSSQTALLSNFPDLPQVFTMQISFSMSQATYYVPIIGTWYNGGGNHWGIWKNNNEKTIHFNCGQSSGTPSTYNSDWTFEWDTWYTLTVHRDANDEVKLYAKSEGGAAQVILTTTNCDRPTTGGIYSVGGYKMGGNDLEIFTGKIRDIAVW